MHTRTIVAAMIATVMVAAPSSSHGESPDLIPRRTLFAAPSRVDVTVSPDGDSIAFRACSRSLPVSIRYKRIALTLSPADLLRHSRATVQGSSLELVSPRAPLLITHVSRGRLVNRTTSS